MAGIIFFKTSNLKETAGFYIEKLGMKLWLDQGACVILQHGNMLLGFCQSQKADTDGIITFFYKTRDEVDRMSRELQADTPVENKNFRIYHFYSEDNEGRSIEFQTFLHPLKEI